MVSGLPFFVLQDPRLANDNTLVDIRVQDHHSFGVICELGLRDVKSL